MTLSSLHLHDVCRYARCLDTAGWTKVGGFQDVSRALCRSPTAWNHPWRSAYGYEATTHRGGSFFRVRGHIRVWGPTQDIASCDAYLFRACSYLMKARAFTFLSTSGNWEMYLTKVQSSGCSSLAPNLCVWFVPSTFFYICLGVETAVGDPAEELQRREALLHERREAMEEADQRAEDRGHVRRTSFHACVAEDEDPARDTREF